MGNKKGLAIIFTILLVGAIISFLIIRNGKIDYVREKEAYIKHVDFLLRDGAERAENFTLPLAEARVLLELDSVYQRIRPAIIEDIKSTKRWWLIP